MGSCQGLSLLNAVSDNALELVVLVNRFQQDVSPTQRRGAFLEAYNLNGTRLGDNDSRWPVVVSTVREWHFTSLWNRDITVRDIDGDNVYEIIQQLQIRPYPGRMNGPGPRHMLEILEIN